MRCWLIVIVAAALSSSKVAAKAMVVLGDSLSTGAGTHPNLQYDSKNLWDVFRGDLSVAVEQDHLRNVPGLSVDRMTLDAPQRLWPAGREFIGGADWLFRNFLNGLSRLYLDTEEYSWGYILGQQLEYRTDEIIIAAENGARTTAIPRHYDRVLDYFSRRGGGPDKVFIFYSGNDLCGPDASFLVTPQEYLDQLTRGLKYILRNAPDGWHHDVYVLSFLGVLQLFHADSILAKEIRAHGSTVTCRELRKNRYGSGQTNRDPGLPPEAWYFGMLMPPNPAAFCPTLFGAGERDQQHSALANRVRKFREQQEKAVQAASTLAQEAGSAIRFHYISQTANLIFTADDVAGDCFHLSILGQGRIANVVKRYLQE